MKAVRAPSAHLAGLDPVPAEPDHRDGGEVDHEHDHRHHPGDEQRGVQVVPGEVLVGRVEAAHFVALPDEAADDVGADDLLAQHPADPVDQLLALPVEGNQAPHDHRHDDGEHGNHRHHDAGQRDVLVDGQGDAAEEDGRRRHEHGEDEHREVLDLGDVVGGPGDEAGRAEHRDFLRGHRLPPWRRAPRAAGVPRPWRRRRRGSRRRRRPPPGRRRFRPSRRRGAGSPGCRRRRCRHR